MGRYATTTSFTDLLPFYLRANTSTSDTAAVNLISAQIDRAEQMVDSFLVARFNVAAWTTTSASGANVPPMVRTLSEDLASWRVIRGAYVKDGEIENKTLKDFEDAKELLKSIASGELGLAYTDGTLVAPLSTQRYLSDNKDFAPIFNLDEPEAWAVDPDRLDSITADRT